MVLLLTAIILSGFANRFAPNYPAFLIGWSPYDLFEKKSLKGWFLGVFLCAFMSLAYGTVMYVWMMEHCDGEPHPWNSYSQTSPSLLQVKSRPSLAPVLTTTLASGVWWPPWSPISSQIGEICRFPTSSSTSPPLSCLIFLIFPLFPTSWSSPCRSCYCTALTGFSRSRLDGCSPTGESRRPRTLSERLPGGWGQDFFHYWSFEI